MVPPPSQLNITFLLHKFEFHTDITFSSYPMLTICLSDIVSQLHINDYILPLLLLALAFRFFYK